MGNMGTDEVTQLIVNELVAEELELFSITNHTRGGEQYFSLKIDKKNGGISLEECVHWTKRIGSLLDAKGAESKTVFVEISSPGIDWPLKSERDYNRIKGKMIRFHVNEDDILSNEVCGVVEDVSSNCLRISYDDNREPSSVQISKIVGAKVVTGY